MANDFRVDPDKLAAVAERVKRLLDDLNGSTGFIQGNKPDFAKADQSAIVDALGSLAGSGDGTSAFAGSYDYEHSGMTMTYDSMITQLQNLYQACQTTAATHSKHETAAKTAVLKPGQHF